MTAQPSRLAPFSYPPWLTSKAAQIEFDRLLILLADRLKPEDQHTLGTIAQLHADIGRELQTLEAEGHDIQAAHGAKSHPAWQRLQQARECLLKYSRKFGMTPMDRQVLKVEPKPSQVASRRRRGGGVLPMPPKD